MSALEFGRAVKRAFELPPLPPGNKPAPAPPPPPPPPPANKTPTWSNFWSGEYYPSNPTPYDDYRRTMSRYISPWNKDNTGAEGQDRGAIDSALKWGTRGAFGTAAVAGTAAAGLAAAPAAATGGAGTTAAAGTGGAVAASQTPAGQNMLQRGVQNASQFANQAGYVYQNNIDPLLKRLNYKPEDALHDVYVGATGHADQIKGPGWSFPTPSMPKGAPTFPRPLETWKNLYSSLGSDAANTANMHLAGAGPR